MSKVVLDSSALLALLRAEPGAGRVIELLGDAVISAVNYAEVISRLADLAVPRPIEHVAKLDLKIEPLDHWAAAKTGALREATRHLGLSLGDRACLALASHLGVAAVTADRAWAAVDVGVEVVLIR